MKFSILQPDLWPSLQAVARSCGVRSQLPVLGNILLQAESGRLQLSATNLEIGVVKSLPAEVTEPGEITVPAKTLVEVVANLGSEKLEFSATIDQLEVATATFSSRIAGIPASEFPSIPLSGQSSITINPKALALSLPEVAFAAAVDNGRPILTGILTEIKANKLQLVATDGYRLARKIIEVEEDANFKALVPRRTFEEVIRLLSEEGVDKVEVSTSDNQNQIIFKLGQTEVSSRLIEGQYPAWEKIIPSQSKARVIIDRQDFLKGVKLASVFARNEANIIKLHNKPGKLILTSEAKELGNQTNQIDAQVEGEEIQIAFNAKFLQETLSSFRSTQMILELSGNLSAAVIKPVGADGLEYIIMPVNLT